MDSTNLELNGQFRNLSALNFSQLAEINGYLLYIIAFSALKSASFKDNLS
jgi:hypothetical protein